MALSTKFQENNLVVIDQFELDQIKTKEFLKVVNALNIKNALIITDKKNKNLELSSRNIPNIKILCSKGLNVYDILKYKKLILLKSSIEDIEGRLLV
jgi:large subunit ribosomal protein L4